MKKPVRRPPAAERMDALIDLHLHLDGSLSPATVREIADLQGMSVPEGEDELRRLLTVSPACRNLNEYLEKFDFPCRLLQTCDALTRATANLLRELAEQGVIYAEIRFAPQKHCAGGLSQDGAVLAVLAGMHGAPIPAGLILCCMRGDDNEAENRETVILAARYRHRGVCGVDLAGAEALYPTADFAGLFETARAYGVTITIHAGEAAGPASVRAALAFGATRIGHGVRAVEDPALLSELSGRGTTLELCPTSNLQTAVFPDLARFPLPELMASGVRVTVNTDNRSVSDTTLRAEWQKLIDTFGLTRAQVGELLTNSANAAFCDDATRTVLLKKIKKTARKI